MINDPVIVYGETGYDLLCLLKSNGMAFPAGEFKPVRTISTDYEGVLTVQSVPADDRSG